LDPWKRAEFSQVISETGFVEQPNQRIFLIEQLRSLIRGRLDEGPGYFAERDRLACQPTARPTRRIFVAPVLWFVDRLTIELKNEFRVTRFQNVSVDILVAGDARVRAHIEISQVMHAGGHARCVSPIAAGMSAQPRFGRAVATFTRHAFIGACARCEPTWSNRLKRRMTNGAACARLRLRDADRFTDPSRTRIQENGIRARVKIFLRPRDILAAFFAGAAVTTGRSTSNRADELGAGFRSLRWFFSRNANDGDCQKRNEAQHAARLAL